MLVYQKEVKQRIEWHLCVPAVWIVVLSRVGRRQETHQLFPHLPTPDYDTPDVPDPLRSPSKTVRPSGHPINLCSVRFADFFYFFLLDRVYPHKLIDRYVCALPVLNKRTLKMKNVETAKRKWDDDKMFLSYKERKWRNLIKRLVAFRQHWRRRLPAASHDVLVQTFQLRREKMTPWKLVSLWWVVFSRAPSRWRRHIWFSLPQCTKYHVHLNVYPILYVQHMLENLIDWRQLECVPRCWNHRSQLKLAYW